MLDPLTASPPGNSLDILAFPFSKGRNLPILNLLFMCIFLLLSQSSLSSSSPPFPPLSSPYCLLKNPPRIYWALRLSPICFFFFCHLQIERIQNRFLWQSYQVKKKQMDIKNGHTNNEKLLFHGTDAASVPQINQHGFNRSFAGKNGKDVNYPADQHVVNSCSSRVHTQAG